MSMKYLGIINDMERGWVKGENQPLWHFKVYDMWKLMWSRVANVNRIDYKYYKDCKIHEDFKYLSNYVDWIESQPRFEEFTQTCDKVMWVIDKDAKQLGNRNYYPEYMTLTTQNENSKERNSRKGKPSKPKTPVIGIKDDSIILLKSMSDGKYMGFNQGEISRCINKKHKTHKTHKGYKWHRVNYKHNKTYKIKGE